MTVFLKTTLTWTITQNKLNNHYPRFLKSDQLFLHVTKFAFFLVHWHQSSSYTFYFFIHCGKLLGEKGKVAPFESDCRDLLPISDYQALSILRKLRSKTLVRLAEKKNLLEGSG